MVQPDTAPSPVFIDFEGIDGSGKTTLSNRLAEFLEEQGIPVHHGRSGGIFRSEISKEIRTLTRDPRFVRMSDATELLLYVARDTQMIDEYIRPKLNPGHIVFCDRYLYSAVVHSHHARGMPREQVDAVIEVAARGLWPDLVVYTDLDPLTSRVRKKIQKIRDRRPSGDFGRKGLMGIGFREEMRKGFLQLAKEDPDRWLVIDNANSTIEESLQRIFDRVSKVLEAKGFKKLQNPRWADLQAAEDKEKSRLYSHVQELLSISDPMARQDAAHRLFYDELRQLVKTNPRYTGLFITGVNSPEANEMREAIIDEEPGIVAYGLQGVNTPEALALRHRLKTIEPAYVARSLSKQNPEFNQMREELADLAPEQVILSIRGSDTDHAWDIRKRCGKRARREVIISLRGLDTDRVWDQREKKSTRLHYPALLESLGGLDTDRAWELRDKLSEEFLPWVLMSLRGVTSDRAWDLRAEHIARAPKIIVKTLGRSNDARAWELRDYAKKYAKEVLDSLSGLDNAAAWNLRTELKEKWPNTAVSSVGARVQSERAWNFRWDMVRENPENLLLLKHVMKATLRTLDDDVDDWDDEDETDFT